MYYIIQSIIGICDATYCGPTGVCIENSFFEGLSYACGCNNGTSNYLNPGPCPGKNQKEKRRHVLVNEM
jgi:hypothetical protein